MTKLIRIESADNSKHKVQVQVFDKVTAENATDFLVDTYNLDVPCAIKEVYIHSGRYLVIRETPVTKE
ncbi:MAG: hypothetical protein ABL951_02570 [Alphaproteobacteria bacterium]